MEIVSVLKSAKKIIEDLQEQLGDHWTDEQRQICGDLRRLATTGSPIFDMIHRSASDQAIDELKGQHTKELQTERAAAQLAVNQLKAQLRDMQERRGSAAIVLERIYKDKYQEIDDFRKARGVTHRIHLTAKDCEDIERAIKG